MDRLQSRWGMRLTDLVLTRRTSILASLYNFPSHMGLGHGLIMLLNTKWKKPRVGV